MKLFLIDTAGKENLLRSEDFAILPIMRGNPRLANEGNGALTDEQCRFYAADKHDIEFLRWAYALNKSDVWACFENETTGDIEIAESADPDECNNATWFMLEAHSLKWITAKLAAAAAALIDQADKLPFVDKHGYKLTDTRVVAELRGVLRQWNGE